MGKLNDLVTKHLKDIARDRQAGIDKITGPGGTTLDTLFRKTNDLDAILRNITGANNNLAEELSSLCCKFQELTDEQLAWSTRIHQLLQIFQASDLTLQAINCRRILNAITFQDKDARVAQIASVQLAQGTYEWILENNPSDDDDEDPSYKTTSASRFKQWLESGTGIFHIAGKPGGGKSTLMNFLSKDTKVKRSMEVWAGVPSSKLVTASAFFWNTGSQDQKSADGLCRSLLHTIINQVDDHQTPLRRLFPNHWAPGEWSPWTPRQDLAISGTEIKTALRTLINDADADIRYCFFIDAADEFQDANMAKWQLAQEFMEWAKSPIVKICFSSREEDPWLSQFPEDRRLRLHRATQEDVRLMIENKILGHYHFATFDPASRDKFLNNFVRIANGVFIWVKLVLEEIIEKLDHRQTVEDLELLLKTVPTELKVFYEEILSKKIRSSDREETWAILNIMVFVAKEWWRPTNLTLHQYSLVKGKPYMPLGTKSQATGRFMDEELFEARAPLLFRGLVGVEGASLAFAHRSVYEYLLARSPFSETKMQTIITIIRSLAAQLNVQRDTSIASDSSIMHSILFWLARCEYDEQILTFPHLDVLEDALLDIQLGGDWSKFSSFFHVGLPGRERKSATLSVFATSCECNLASYTDWVIRRDPKPEWLAISEAQASIFACLCNSMIRCLHLPEGTGVQQMMHVLHQLLQQRFDPNAVTLLPNLSYGPTQIDSWKCKPQGSVWQFVLRHCARIPNGPRIWRVIALLLKYGPLPDATFSFEGLTLRYDSDMWDVLASTTTMTVSGDQGSEIAQDTMYLPREKQWQGSLATLDVLTRFPK